VELSRRVQEIVGGEKDELREPEEIDR